ncbi:MAG: hypothetical protein K6G66_08140 [Oscillospiraceae bacterium]|nr:hypothetical protein [Oscillospiraceae bacterium]
MKKRKRIKKGWIIAAIILMVILVIVAILYLWQQDNIKAAANARRFTETELRQQLADSRSTVQMAVEQNGGITVRDLTDEERQALHNGEFSMEQMVRRLTRTNDTESEVETLPAPPVETVMPTEQRPTDPAESEPPAPEETPHQPTQQELNEQRISELVAQVYIMREQYVAILDGMASQAMGEYAAMPESERTKAKLAGWASGYFSRASDLEKQCDAEMDKIVAEMSTLLKENGSDLELVDLIISSYAEEKSIQKSIYFQELEKRGIV